MAMRVLGGHNATAFLFDSSIDLRKHSDILNFQKVGTLYLKIGFLTLPYFLRG